MYVDEKKHGEIVIDEVGQAMLDAAKYIETKGWCQLRIKDERGGVCLIGAFSHLNRMAEWPEAHKRMGFPKREGSWHAIEWNNAPGRTAEEVIARLRQFA